MFVNIKFSIRQLLVFTLIVGLSLQARIQWKRVAILEALYESERATCGKLDERARPLRQQTAVCKMVVKDWPLRSEIYLAAKERFERLQTDEEVMNDR